MAAWAWIVIVIVVVVVIAALAFGTMRRRRSAMLRQRFGPEYDRTVETREDRRAAEAELRAREKQRAQFTVKPLPEAIRLSYASEWRQVQERFVDQPIEAVAAADALVTQVMRERGYPADQFETQADVVSVDHPGVAENYRFGHAIWQQSQTEQVSTEDLREALLRYRSLFDELLRPDATETAATETVATQTAATQTAATQTAATETAATETAATQTAATQTAATETAATGTGRAGFGEPAPRAAGDGRETTAAGPMEAPAAPAPDTQAQQTGGPAYQDQPARGGRP